MAGGWLARSLGALYHSGERVTRQTWMMLVGALQVSNCTGNVDSSRNHRPCKIIGLERKAMRSVRGFVVKASRERLQGTVLGELLLARYKAL